jgi:hypothetical protein
LPNFKKSKALNKNKETISVTVPSHYHGVAFFVVSTADSEGVLGVFSGSDNWYVLLPKELVTTRLTKYSKTAFAI